MDLKMNLKIVGKLLERTIKLSKDLNRKPQDIISGIYRRGLDAVEMRKGVRLHCFSEPRELTDKDKVIIRENPHSSIAILSERLAKNLSQIRRYRLDLATEYLKNGFTIAESDFDAGSRFGLKVPVFRALRLVHGIHRPKGIQNLVDVGTRYPELGTVKDIRQALLEGGYNLISLFEAKGYKVKRERARQIIDEIGATVDKRERKPIWYAIRLCGRDRLDLAHNLADPDWVKRQLAQSGGASALASKLGLGPASLGAFIYERLHMRCKDLIRSHGEMVELKCDFCESSIFRPRWLVERRKKVNPDKLHYCSKVCQGRHLGHNGKGKPKVAKKVAK